MAQEDWAGLEAGGGPDKRAAVGSGSGDLERPLLKTEASGNPTERRHRRGHSLRSRRDAELPDSAYAIFSTLVVALGPLSLGFALGFTSPTQAAIIKDLNLTIGEFSTFGSILNVGCMMGAITSGRLADLLGRKLAIQLAVIPLLAGWGLIALGNAAVTLIVARILIGFGGGIISFTVPMYLGEISPKHLRGSLGAMNQLFITIGITLSYTLGMFCSWRVLAILGGIPELALVIGVSFISESPRWLVKAGQEEELSSCLQKLRGKEFDVGNEIAEIQAATAASNALPRVKLSDLKQRRLFRPLVVGIGLMILQQFSGINAIMLYANKIFSTAGVSNPDIASIALGTIQVIMSLVAAGLMDKAGRRILLMVSAGGMALSSFLVGLSFYLRALPAEKMSDAWNTFIGELALISLLVYIVAYSLGMGAIPWIIMSEIFPAHVKGVAGSVATLINWFCSYAVTMTFNYMLLWSSTGSFWIFAAVCVGAVAFVGLLVPETRGRTLEQIQSSFT